MKPALMYLLLKMQGTLLLVFGDRSGALVRFKQMLQLLPLDRYALASCAHAQAQRGDLEEAIANLKQLTCAWPQEAAAWFNLGYVLQQAGRQAEAEPAFRNALHLDARMDRAWYGLGLALIHLQRFHDALEALKNNTILQPMSPYGWYRMAQAHMALGQNEEVRKLIGHLRQFEPAVAAQLERESGVSQDAGRPVDDRGAPAGGGTPSRVRNAAH